MANKINGDALRKRLGFFTTRDASELLGIEYMALRNVVRGDIVPRPATPFGGSHRLYYTMKDIEKMRAILSPPK